MRRLHAKQACLPIHPVDEEVVERFEILEEIAACTQPALSRIQECLAEGKDAQRGREGMSAEQALRFLIVKMVYHYSYRKMHQVINDSILLREFCRCAFTNVPKPSTLEENIKKIGWQALDLVNQAVLSFARDTGLEDGRCMRSDATAVETNIHEPRDSQLILDCVRVVLRILEQTKKTFLLEDILFHSRLRVTTKLNFKISNCAAADRPALYQRMLDYGQEVYVYGREALEVLRRVTGSNQRKANVAAKELERYLELMEKVLDQTRRRVLNDEKVPADQKILSIFEDHTDIIAKGQRKAVFGHKVYVTTGRSSLILACRVERGNPNDSTLFCPLLDRHIQTFGKAPAHASADGAFGSKANAEYARLKGVEAMCFGPLANDQTLRRELMHFRAGIEGVISALKRGVGLDRCDWRGWASFQSYVWAAVLAHNVKTIANTLQERRKAKRRRNKKGRRNAA